MNRKKVLTVLVFLLIIACFFYVGSHIEPGRLIEVGGVFAIAATIFAETGLLIGFFLPGDTLLFAAGFFAAQGRLNLASTLFAIILAAFLGNIVGYEIGKRNGKRIFSKDDSVFFHKKYIDSAEDSDNSPGFLQVVAQYGDWLLYHAEKSLERLMQSQYQDLVNEARDWGGLVHGDTAARNFLRSGNKVYLIDFDAIALDVFVTDLWRLLRRTLSRTGWETALAEEILCKYNRFVPVEARHREVLGAFLQFPEIPWRIMREYFERPDKTIRYELFLTERLENYLAQHREIERFLKKF